VKKEKERESSPPLLGRKERAARALAQQLKKQTKGEPFSIRSLVDSDDRGGPSSPAPRSLQPAILYRPAIPKKMVAPGKKGAAAVNDLRKLAPGRDGWDRRSIDEIARDLKASRGKVEAPVLVRTKSSDGPSGLVRTNGNQRPKSTSPGRTTKTKSKPPPIPSSARPPPSSLSLKRPRRSSSSSSSTSSPPPRRNRLLDPNNIADISSEIQSLFRRPGAAPRYAASDVSSDDMEARMSDVEEEERRAARIAKREDEIAEREERERREKKERLKRAGR
jgi:protein SPT2